MKRKSNAAVEQLVDMLRTCGHDADLIRGMTDAALLIERREVCDEITRGLPKSRVYHLHGGPVIAGELLQSKPILDAIHEAQAET